MELQSEFLSPAELKDLTAQSKTAAQVEILERERIPHKVLGSRVKVSRYHVREWLAGRLAPASRGGVRLDLVK
jgi:hypothetical protein